jgi:hypothetical protein
MPYLESMFYVLIGWALASVPFGILAGRVAGWADRDAVDAMTAALPTDPADSAPIGAGELSS